jgi:site-specific recombinase XerD
MNLQTLIERYVTYQQSLGAQFKTNAEVLRAFGRSVGARATVAGVRPAQVDAFLLGKGPVTRTWYKKLSILRAFYQYAVARGYADAAPLPALVPRKPPPFVPYIFAPDDLRRLFATAAAHRPPRHGLEPATLRALLVVLYGAGLRLREALNLDRADVDLDSALLTIRRTKFGKTRLVPLGPPVGRVLAAYARRAGVAPADAPFFRTRAGARVKAAALQQAFRLLCERAGIRRTDGASEQPRLHDLRHTFAVHRLTAWYREGADVQRLVHHLSVYLGHAHLSGTQVYLTMTPDLLQRAGTRFERYARGEGGHA